MLDKPKRPMSAYMLWLNSVREKLKAENPDLKITEIAKKGGQIWRSMKDKSVWEEKAAQAREQYTKALESYNLGCWEERKQYTEDLKSYNFVQSQLNKTKPRPGPNLDHEYCLLEAGTKRSTGDGDHQKDVTNNNVIDELGDMCTSGSKESSIAEPLKPENLGQSAKRIRMDSPDVSDSQKLHDPDLRARVQKKIRLEQLEKHETGCSGSHTRAQPGENDFGILRDVKTEPQESSITSCPDYAIVAQNEPSCSDYAIIAQKEPSCSDCAIIAQNQPDNRIDYFSNLIKAEFQYVQPCMRTRMFARILNYLHTLKKFHSNDLDLTDSEENY